MFFRGGRLKISGYGGEDGKAQETDRVGVISRAMMLTQPVPARVSHDCRRRGIGAVVDHLLPIFSKDALGCPKAQVGTGSQEREEGQPLTTA